MTEMHLDLCIQSTTHLLETVASVKENIRILEVFLNSGLTPVEYISKGYGVGSENYSGSFSGGSTSYDKRSYQPFIDMTPSDLSNNKNHLNCCCMCRFRLGFGANRENLNRTESRASATTMSLTSNSTNMKRKVPSGPRLIPRLNRTASLRRETVLQKVGRKNSFL